MTTQRQIILSLSDVIKAVKNTRILIYLTTLLFTLFSFYYFLSRPVTFTAKGIFKGNTSQSSTTLSKAMEFLGGGESYSSSDDPRTFLRSYPVLEQVVRHLNLQAAVSEKVIGNKFKQMWYTYKTERAYHHLKKHQPNSRILNKSVYTPSNLVIPDNSSSITCSSVTFPGETAQALKIVFQDANTYTVWDHKQNLGSGILDLPFSWNKGSFTLSGEGRKGKKIVLSLIPLAQAVDSLSHSLIVQKEKENAQLVNISFSHRNRHLATLIVNETMRQFEQYLQFEGKKKITKQLDYLKQRQEETMGELETIMEGHRAYLESHLDLGDIITLEKELEYMAEQQGDTKQELQEIGSEMQRLASITSKQAAHLPALLDELESTRHKPIHALTLESARSLIYQHQHQLDSLHLENEKFDYCLTKLSEVDFDSSSLSKTLGDPSVLSRFEKMHALHLKLLDEKNWTEKERGHLKAEIETEKQFMIQHINHLKEGTALQERALRSRVQTLQENLLYLLYDSYRETQNALKMLAQQAAHFPQKWVTEQKIELNTKLYSEIMESITKMIEAKNINYNLDYLMAGPLKRAKAPVLPNHPHLLLGTCFGAIAGAFLALLVLCFREVWKGPSASYENLSSQKWLVVTKEETVKTLGFTLIQGGKVALLCSQIKPTIVTELTDWLKKRKENVFILEHLPDTPLSSSNIATLKEKYDRVIIQFSGSPKGIETEHLCSLVDTPIFGINAERMHELDKLPENTLFYFEQVATKKMTLRQMRPILAKLIRTYRKRVSSSFLTKSALRKFPLKKT